MASNQPHTKRDVGGQKDSKSKDTPASPQKQPAPAKKPSGKR